MSKSVTVIHGSVWTQQSVTRDRNMPNVGGGGGGDEDCNDGPKGGRGRGHGHDRHEHRGEEPDESERRQGEWVVQEGRTFTRRVRTN